MIICNIHIFLSLFAGGLGVILLSLYSTSLSVSKAGLKLAIFLCQPLQYWDYRHVPRHLALYSRLTLHEPKSALVQNYRKGFHGAGEVVGHTRIPRAQSSGAAERPASSEASVGERCPLRSPSSSLRVHWRCLSPLAASVPATLKTIKHLHISRPSVHRSPRLTRIPQQLATACCFFSSSPTLKLHIIPPALSRKHVHTLPSSPPPFPISTVYIISILTLGCSGGSPSHPEENTMSLPQPASSASPILYMAPSSASLLTVFL